MIQYVVVTGTPAATRRLASRLLPALRATRLFDGTEAVHIGPSATWAVAAISTFDRVCAKRLRVDGDSMIVVNGPALANDGHQAALSRKILRRYVAGGPPGVARFLGGSYNFVGIAARHGLHAFADFSGLYPLYWGQAPGAAVVSNRSTTVAELLGRPVFDARDLAWLIGHNNLFGDRMTARDVSFLPAGLQARVEPGSSRVRVERSPVWIWPAPDSEPRPNLTAAEWDAITDDLVGNFRSVGQVTRTLTLRLSGGKDSRLCLALAKAAGLQDLVRTVTVGKLDNPEVACAAAVSEVGGFPHQRAGPPAPAPAAASEPAGLAASDVQIPPQLQPDRIWQRLRQAVYRFEGIVCPWDGSCDPLTGAFLFVSGFGGELYRGPGGHAKRFKRRQPETVDEMAEMFVDYHQVHDPLRALSPIERRYQAEWMRSWVHEAVDVVRFDLLPEKFFVDYRLGHWNGPLGQYKPGHINVNPLLSPVAASRVVELQPDVRSAERFHFEVMLRTAPELLSVPFLGDTWSPSIIESSPVPLPTEPFPVERKPTPRLMKSWQWPFLESQPHAIEDRLVEAARTSPMGEVCDVQRLCRAVHRAHSFNSNVKGKAIISAVAVALALLGRAEPFVDDPQPPRGGRRRGWAATAEPAT